MTHRLSNRVQSPRGPCENRDCRRRRRATAAVSLFTRNQVVVVRHREFSRSTAAGFRAVRVSRTPQIHARTSGHFPNCLVRTAVVGADAAHRCTAVSPSADRAEPAPEAIGAAAVHRSLWSGNSTPRGRKRIPRACLPSWRRSVPARCRVRLGTTTAYRYVAEAVDVPASFAPTLTEAVKVASTRRS